MTLPAIGHELRRTGQVLGLGGKHGDEEPHWAPLVASGEIGRIYHVGAHFLQQRWLTPDPSRPWRFDRRRAGSGILGDLGVHIFDLLIWITGQPITRVCAQMASFGPKPEVPGQEPVTGEYGAVIYDLHAHSPLEGRRSGQGRGGYRLRIHFRPPTTGG